MVLLEEWRGHASPTAPAAVGGRTRHGPTSDEFDGIGDEMEECLVVALDLDPYGRRAIGVLLRDRP